MRLEGRVEVGERGEPSPRGSPAGGAEPRERRSTTSWPQRARWPAMPAPVRPVLAFVRTRTPSIGSAVPPLVTRTRRRRAGPASAASIAATMSCGSASRPSPVLAAGRPALADGR